MANGHWLVVTSVKHKLWKHKSSNTLIENGGVWSGVHLWGGASALIGSIDECVMMLKNAKPPKIPGYRNALRPRQFRQWQQDRSNKQNIQVGDTRVGFTKSILVTSLKKRGINKRVFHRRINLMSHINKLIMRILIIRAQSRIRPEIGWKHLCQGYWKMKCDIMIRIMSQPLTVTVFPSIYVTLKSSWFAQSFKIKIKKMFKNEVSVNQKSTLIYQDETCI